MDGDGRWSCARFNADISTDNQRQGAQCPEHRFIPALLPWAEPVDADETANWVEYHVDQGVVFRNGPGGDGVPGYASTEIKALRAGDP